MARIGVIADIHSNYTALDKVLEHNALQGLELICLGDIVGYGPRPAEVIDRLRQLDIQGIKGNHDAAVLGDDKVFKTMRSEARKVVGWTRKRLDADQQHFLSLFPVNLNTDFYSCYHGSPRRPLLEYVDDPSAVAAAMRDEAGVNCLVLGHVHKPLCCVGESADSVERLKIKYGEAISFADQRILINPGSIGQPRDGDPRAAFAILDEEKQTVTFHRVEYDVKETARRIRLAQLPPFFASRLSSGR
jgi:diadenosine tetraphosphatase ApaH/serine/threonine PP2A family protein phosphatase